MPTQTPDCSKCRRAMAPGVLLDGAQYDRQTRWMEGVAEFGRWFKVIKTKNRAKFTVTTYRCAKCGYLESYADTPVAD